jgi:hypothetical protein
MLVLVAAVVAPLALVCVFAAGPLLRAVFGAQLDGAAGALPWLTVAMALFACANVAVQHALATGARQLLALLAVVAVAEPVLLLVAGGAAPEDLAGTLAAVQLVLAAAAIAAAVRAARGPSQVGA